MNKLKIASKDILRIRELEKNIGIDEMNIYAYITHDYVSKKIIINGELYSENITKEIKMNAIVYDEDGDIIISGANALYGRVWTTSYIHPLSVNGLFPFRIELEIPDNIIIKQIRVYPS